MKLSLVKKCLVQFREVSEVAKSWEKLRIAEF